MKNSINISFFIDEEMLQENSMKISGNELKRIMEERSGKLVSLHVCRCESSENFLDSLEENLKHNFGNRMKTIYVLWGREPDMLISERQRLKLLMEKGRKEMGWSYVFMGGSAACRKLSQKTGLTELTNIRHSPDLYGVRGALRCCADIVGKICANPA